MEEENERKKKLNQERIKSADRKRYFQLAHKRVGEKEPWKGGKKAF